MERLERNIESLRERIKTESNPQARWRLQRPLIQEEDRIGFSRELVDLIDCEIAGWHDWINRQRSIVERLEDSGRESKLAKDLLFLAQQTLAVHEFHRQRILNIVAAIGASSRRRAEKQTFASN